MKLIPAEAKKIKITFSCDLCGVDVSTETDVAPYEIYIEAVCSVCHKNFSVKVSMAGVEVNDIADNDINIEVL